MGLQLHRQDDTSTAVDSLMLAMGIAAESLRLVGPALVEIVTLRRGRICLQPTDLNRGEQLVQILGCESPLDHRMFVPGHTLWTGERGGLEVQVRSALRKVVAR
ncbi:hypothetical protein J2S48_001230 [Promicromonospora iranensis]|uniref:Uncharacterized protein n=1 Tax=Promicromonospora iranensis TaxID=1105144 RepID=A0ABU2CK61_9MICO|nr:hypothetical protein [Promicromonospora iranensis]